MVKINSKTLAVMGVLLSPTLFAETVDLTNPHVFNEYQSQANTLSAKAIKAQQAEIEALKQAIYRNDLSNKTTYNTLTTAEKQVFNQAVKIFLSHFQQCNGDNYYQKDINYNIQPVSKKDYQNLEKPHTFVLNTETLTKVERKQGITWKGKFKLTYFNHTFSVISTVLANNKLYYYYQDARQNPVRGTIFSVYKPFDCQQLTQPIIYKIKLDKRFLLNQELLNNFAWERPPKFSFRIDTEYKIRVKIIVDENGRVNDIKVIEPADLPSQVFYQIQEGLRFARIPATGKLTIIQLPIRIIPLNN